MRFLLFADTAENHYICGVKHLYKYIVALLLILATHAAKAEGGRSALRFDAATFDYGHVREDGGAVRSTFRATNTSDQVIEVVQVVTSCGCTSAEYRRGPVEPGGEFTMHILFDPFNRPGRIDKYIYVYTSDSSEVINLKIIGNVIPRERTIDELFPFWMGGGLRLQTNFHAFSYIEHGASVEERIGYVNDSDREISLTLLPALSSGALHVEYARTIAPHAMGDIVLRYSLPLQSTRYGTLHDHLRVIVDGVASDTQLTTYAVAVDNFNFMDDISAPKADIPKKIIKFGVVKCDDITLEDSFTVRNDGASPLLIRCVECSSEAISCDIKPNTAIAAGEGRTFVVRFNPKDINPDIPFAGRVTLIMNDMLRPMQQIKVSALPE